MRKRLAILGTVLLAYAAPASADSFVLRPPSALDLDFEGNGFVFLADGFSAGQVNPPFGLSFGQPSNCDPCTVGETYDPSFHATNTYMGTGNATIGDATYFDVEFFGDLAFEAVASPFPGTDATGLEIRTPFTFTGTLRGFQATQPAFSVDLTGTGLATRFWDNNGDGRFFAGENRLTYFFTDSAVSATPEPASLLLLATGVGALAARKRITRT